MKFGILGLASFLLLSLAACAAPSSHEDRQAANSADLAPSGDVEADEPASTGEIPSDLAMEEALTPPDERKSDEQLADASLDSKTILSVHRFWRCLDAGRTEAQCMTVW